MTWTINEEIQTEERNHARFNMWCWACVHVEWVLALIQGAHGLCWLQLAYSRPLSPRAIFTNTVGHTDLGFGVRSGFISRSVRARLGLHVFMYSG